MIRHTTRHVITMGPLKLEPEVTPGGHFVKVTAAQNDWSGLYRYETELLLVARCIGNPPEALVVDQPTRLALEEVVLNIALVKSAREEDPPRSQNATRPSKKSSASPFCVVEEDLQTVKGKYIEKGWNDAEVIPFIHDMAAAYGQANLVVCRAGATTIAELMACGRPAILIPFPYAANDHQRANAEALAHKGAALMIDQKDIDGETLARMIIGLLAKPEELKSMARVARSLGKKGAAELILQACRQVVVEKKAA